jgi:hypothetical protein
VPVYRFYVCTMLLIRPARVTGRRIVADRGRLRSPMGFCLLGA